jgi:TPR repeat protein
MHARCFLVALLLLLGWGGAAPARPLPAVDEDAVTRPDDTEIVEWMGRTASMTEAERASALDAILARMTAGGGETPRTDFMTCAALAHRGEGRAQYCVGQAYENGTGVVEDPTDAYVWYALAARAGYGAGAEARERVKTLLVSVYPAPTDEELGALEAAALEAVARLGAEARK